MEIKDLSFIIGVVNVVLGFVILYFNSTIKSLLRDIRRLYNLTDKIGQEFDRKDQQCLKNMERLTRIETRIDV